MANIVKGQIGNALMSVAPDGIVATADAIYDETKGKSQEQINEDTKQLLAEQANNIGYYECGTAAATAAKEITGGNYKLPDAAPYGGTLKVKFKYKNSAANPTLSINGSPAKPLYYNGAIASSTNTWEDGDVLDLYYDGTNFNARSVVEKFATGEKVKNVGIDSEPTAGSNNLVKSRGVDAASKYKADKNINRIIDGKAISSSTGVIGINADYVITEPLPVINGYGFSLNVNAKRCSCYTSPIANSSTFLGNISINFPVPSGTKYIIFTIAKTEDIQSLDIVPLFDIANDYMFIKPQKMGWVKYEYLAKLKRFLNDSVVDFFIHGTSILKDTLYTCSILKENNSNNVRILIYDVSNVKLFDKTYTPINGIIDEELGNATCMVRLKADLNIEEFGELLMGTVDSQRWIVTSKMLNSLNGNDDNVTTIETSQNIIDASNLFTSESGAIAGYVSYNDGAYGGEGTTLFIVTDYIPVKNKIFIRSNIPTGTNAGVAFYDFNKSAITNYKGTYKAGYRDTTDGSSNINKWKAIPSDAAFVRVTAAVESEKKLDFICLTEENEDKVVHRNYNQLKPRVSHIIWDYKDFDGMSGKSRASFTQNTLNENIRQVKSLYQQFGNRVKYEVAFKPDSNDCLFGIGFEFGVMTELRVVGNQLTIKCGSSPFDTYTQIDPTIVFTYDLSFTITPGNTYKIGIIKRDAYKIGDTFYSDATFYIDDFNGNYYEKVITRNAPALDYNGVAGRYITLCYGTSFISIKQGSATVININLSSDYKPCVKALISGDSFVDGDTMVSDGEDKKYASLIQQTIGQDDFVIVGRGGEELSDEWFVYIQQYLMKYCPDYFIVALGTNNRTYSTYIAAMNMLLDWLDSVGIIPILVTITPIKTGSDTDARSEFRIDANTWVRNSGRLYVDINKAVTTDAVGAVWNPDYVRADGIHPTVAGHTAIFEAFKKEVPELFNV